MAHSPRRQVCLTVDMEQDCPPYLDTWRGMTEGVPRLLALLASEQVPTTCFVTGDAASRHPQAVSALVAAGHELGCHGMTHRRFTDLTDHDARWEITGSARLLRAFAPVTAFRAPNLQFPNRFLPYLEEAGFRLDSSQARYKRGANHRHAAPTRLTRIPASVTSSVLRLPAWLRDPWLRAQINPVVLFVHPWEFVDLTRERLRLDCRFATGQPALRALRAVIRLFRADGAQFTTMGALPAPP